MLKDLVEKMGNTCEQRENFSTEMKATKKGQMEMLDLKNIVMQMKNSSYWLYNRLDVARQMDRNYPNWKEKQVREAKGGRSAEQYRCSQMQVTGATGGEGR